LARAGLAAATTLADLAGGSQVRASDGVAAAWRDGQLDALRERGIAIHMPADGEDLLTDHRTGCVVKSPGVPFDAPVLTRAAELGIPVIDELELGWRLARVPLVAVTGTNGKSTVSMLIAAAMANGQVVGNSEFGPPLSAAAPAADNPLVCEVSSYQLEGCPGLLPEAAVLTNLRADHLQRHGSLREYAACKRKLFVRGTRSVGLAVVNDDDAFGRSLGNEVGQLGGKVVRFGRRREADFRLRDCGWALTEAWLWAETPDGPVRIEHRQPGVHNAENVLAAAAATRALGLGWDRILAALEWARPVPGRFEAIDEGQPFDVVVDFAHTPDAVEVVLHAVRTLAARRGGRVLTLVSVAGNRPTELNAPIGAAAGRLADLVIVSVASLRAGSAATTVEPLYAAAAAAASAPVELVRDRRLAVRAILAEAREGDVVLVVGRGARPRLAKDLSGAGPAFDDRVVAREELRLLGYGTLATSRAYSALR
jgi:UDP-N-acetylmuramoyl-L-alanyl-D-glutamate--2,6-diaminopimelate ligase